MLVEAVSGAADMAAAAPPAPAPAAAETAGRAGTGGGQRQRTAVRCRSRYRRRRGDAAAVADEHAGRHQGRAAGVPQRRPSRFAGRCTCARRGSSCGQAIEGFDERKYGFASVVDLLRAAGKEGVFRIERDRQGAVRVFPGANLVPEVGDDGGPAGRYRRRRWTSRCRRNTWPTPPSRSISRASRAPWIRWRCPSRRWRRPTWTNSRWTATARWTTTARSPATSCTRRAEPCAQDQGAQLAQLAQPRAARHGPRGGAAKTARPRSPEEHEVS